MKLLLIDTCGTTGSVAIADTSLNSSIVATALLPGRSASEQLVATIRTLASSCSTPLQSLDAIAVVSGPGSFTGVRVGLSAAKGLCEALNLPLIAVSRLAILASIAASPLTFALLDAGRGEFYLGVYADNLPARESLVTRDQLIAAIDATQPLSLITCDPSVAQSLSSFDPLLIPEPTAKAALPLVMRRATEHSFDDVATIDANYLRRTDAEIFAKRNAATSPETHGTLVP